jgi:hypothetical protein
MLCLNCTKRKKIEVEMNHSASYVVARDVVEYEEWCPRCGTCFEGTLVRRKVNGR